MERKGKRGKGRGEWEGEGKMEGNKSVKVKNKGGKCWGECKREEIRRRGDGRRGRKGIE